jgi:D-alanine-D-alanine ligase
MKIVGIICGGKSAEHEISLVSARNIIDAIDKNIYDVKLITISRNGHWFFSADYKWLPLNASEADIDVADHGIPLAILAGKKTLLCLNDEKKEIKLDVVFPIIHGTQGEDGSLQGLLELLDIPYVGPGILGSAVGMDKDYMKRLLIQAGIAVSPGLVLNNHNRGKVTADEIFAKLGTPVFVKPANSGSSVGVSKASNKEELDKAIKHAFEFDEKILIEEAIKGREIECALLGNEDAKASPIGEVIAHDDFYSYKAKYLDENGATLAVPAKLSATEIQNAQSAAKKTFEALNCEGLSRVDMFLKDNGDIIVNEINTLPGFTRISMYPSLWQNHGLSYSGLIGKLLELAVKRYERLSKIKKSKD